MLSSLASFCGDPFLLFCPLNVSIDLAENVNANIKVRMTSYKLRGQEWSRDSGAKNVSKKPAYFL